MSQVIFNVLNKTNVFPRNYIKNLTAITIIDVRIISSLTITGVTKLLCNIFEILLRIQLQKT